MPRPQPADVLRPGLLISQRGFGASVGGTLGCFVVDNASGQPMILRNSHVLEFYRNARDDSGTLDLIHPCGAEILAYAEGERDLLASSNFGVGTGEYAAALRVASPIGRAPARQ